MIVLLVLIALAVAIATAVPQLAGRGAPEIAPGRLARRVGALLLVVVAFVVAFGNGSAVSSATYAMFAGVAALVLVALGAFWLYRDRKAQIAPDDRSR